MEKQLIRNAITLILMIFALIAWSEYPKIDLWIPMVFTGIQCLWLIGMIISDKYGSL